MLAVDGRRRPIRRGGAARSLGMTLPVVGRSVCAVTMESRLSACSEGLSRLPRHFYIDIGNVCNLRCPFCMTGAGVSEQPSGLMSLGHYRVILGKIRPVAKLVSLYNWGEPMMNRDLLGMVAETAAAGIHVHIDSNMSVTDLTALEAEAIIGSGLSSLFVSLDGASQGGYAHYRVRGRFDRVVANLRELLAAKVRLGVARPFLGWQYHVHRFNQHEVGAAAGLAEELGVPIVFKPLSTPLPEWRHTLGDGARLFRAGQGWVNQVYAPPLNPDLVSMALHHQVLSPCRQLWGTMVVEWNGDVYPCTVVSSPGHVMGNLLRDSLDHVWNGAAFQRSRVFIRRFGPAQNGGSVCENNACAMVSKVAMPAGAG